MMKIFSSGMKKVEAASPAASRVTPTAPVVSTQQDIKVAYLGMNELTAVRLKDLADVAEGCALIMGFVSPDLNLSEVAQAIKREVPTTTKVILMTTSGELCRPQGSSSLYCTAPDGRAKVLLQSFSNRMIEDAHIMSIPLPSEDLRSGEVKLTVNERVAAIRREIDKLPVPFRLSVAHTLNIRFRSLAAVQPVI